MGNLNSFNWGDKTLRLARYFFDMLLNGKPEMRDKIFPFMWVHLFSPLPWVALNCGTAAPAAAASSPPRATSDACHSVPAGEDQYLFLIYVVINYK